VSAENGISSPAMAVGSPTFCTSSRVSSSVLSSIASASLSRSSIRSFGIFERHSDQAFFAASTARSTSSVVPRGTSAIASPVVGFNLHRLAGRRLDPLAADELRQLGYRHAHGRPRREDGRGLTPALRLP
jgi:hypothetical protein